MLNLRFNTGHQKKEHTPQVQARARWMRLKAFVHRRQYRAFMSEAQAASTLHRQAAQRTTLRLPSDFFQLDPAEELSAGDKLAKIVTQQVLRLREEHAKLGHGDGNGRSGGGGVPLSQEEIEAVQQDEEAYGVVSRALVFPLLEHRDLMVLSTEDLSAGSDVGPSTAGTNGKQRQHSSHKEQGGGDQKKVTAVVLKHFKEKVKVWLKESNVKPEGVDDIYWRALLDFYDDILKKRAAQVVSAGSTYDDLVTVFETNCRKELQQKSEQNPSVPAYHPFDTMEDAIVARVQPFIELLNTCIEEVRTEEMIAMSKNRRMSREKARSGHKRHLSKILASGAGQGSPGTRTPTLKHSASKDEVHVHSRNPTEPTEDSEELMSPDVKEHLSGESVAMTEWVKDSFMVSRRTHERHLNNALNSNEPKNRVKEFQKRIDELENDEFAEDESEVKNEFYDVTSKSFSRQNKDAVHYWRKLERRALLKYIARTQKMYIEAAKKAKEDAQATSPTTVEESKTESNDSLDKDKKSNKYVTVKVRVIEAKNLAIKDDDGQSDPYAVVEWGRERYETNVINNTLFPLWDQEVTLRIKASTHKPLKVVVWDKDDEAVMSPFTKKFWKDEADDFLGQAVFTIEDMLVELRQSPSRRFKKWYDLQKRTRRSHVSGAIHLQVTLVEDLKDQEEAYQLKITQQLNSVVSPPPESVPELVPMVDVEEPVQSLVHFADYKAVYRHVLKKLVVHDLRIGLGEGVLSRVSESILDEIGERWRLNTFWRDLCYFEVLIAALQDNMSLFGETRTTAQPEAIVSVNALIAVYRRLEEFGAQNNACMTSVKLVCPPKKEMTADSKIITNPAVLSGMGDLVTPDSLLLHYSNVLSKLIEYQKTQIQRYKDHFPCDTPSGALVGTLSLLSMAVDNPILKMDKSTSDSGVSVQTPIVEKIEEKEVTFTERLIELVQIGTLERFMRLNEMAAPMEKNHVLRLVKLAGLIIDEIEADKTYFQRPFSADLNIVSITASIYLKQFTLEMQLLVSELAPNKKDVITDDAVKATGQIFELYYRVRELQEKYLPLIDQDDDVNETLKQGFSLHSWFAPCIHTWLIQSEKKMLEWINSAVELDSFQAVNADGNILHSTSVIDLFFCCNQVVECLKKLEFETAGGAGMRDLNDEVEMRRRHWCMFLTRFGRTMSRVLNKYCEVMSHQVLEDRLRHLKQTKEAASKLTLEGALSSLTASRQSLTQSKDNLATSKQFNEWLTSSSKTTKQLCIRVNNIEAARSQLHDMHESLEVASISEWMANRLRRERDKNDDNENQVSGILTVEVVCAENLIACDSDGTSDPYCVVKVTQDKPKSQVTQAAPSSSFPWGQTPKDADEKIIARTKTIPGTLQPRWKEEFNALLIKASQLTVSVYDYDLIGSDDICGEIKIPISRLKPLLQTADSQDIWLDLQPQGRVLLRVQLESMAYQTESGLADIDYYFRKAFRELKRNTSDLLGIMIESVIRIAQREISKILRDTEKKGKQGAGDTEFKVAALFGNSHSSEKELEGRLVELEEIEQAMIPLTACLNDMLSVLAQQLYPRLSKELLKGLWKELLHLIELFMLPSLFGSETITGFQPPRSKPLTQRQVQMLIGCLEILKTFFHADGDDMGLAMSVLESSKYNDIQTIASLYWKDRVMLKHVYTDMLADPSNAKVKNADVLLRLIRIRMDRDMKHFFETELKHRTERQRLIQTSAMTAV